MPRSRATEPAPHAPRAAPGCALALLALLLPLTSLAQTPPDPGFPRSALQIRGASGGLNWLNIRIADTEAHRELGLMFVTRLPSDEGMLFLEDKPQIITMWMKNTLIPLDMLFMDPHGKILCVLANARPESLDLLSCDKPAKAVLEIAGGEAERRGIKVGDTVVHAAFHNK